MDMAECSECHGEITQGTDTALGILYDGSTYVQFRGLEKKIRYNLQTLPELDDATIFAFSFSDQYRCEPTDLVLAVKHKLEEEAGV